MALQMAAAATNATASGVRATCASNNFVKVALRGYSRRVSLNGDLDGDFDADVIIHETYRRLNSTFITPLDPEDIHSLSSHLDDVIDGIEDAVHRMVAYRVEPIPPMVVEMCRIVQSCGHICEAPSTGR